MAVKLFIYLRSSCGVVLDASISRAEVGIAARKTNIPKRTSDTDISRLINAGILGILRDVHLGTSPSLTPQVGSAVQQS